jgi:hypothetical protein
MSKEKNSINFEKSRAMIDHVKIKCIGFSVTGYGNPTYSIAMENIFKQRGHNVEVTFTAVGGLSIDALPYLLKTIVKKGDVDLVILEIATSWFSFIRTHQEEADNYIKLIINYFESIGVKLIFLNLYRKDTDDNDIVVQAIHALASGKYPILDFKAHYRKQFTETGEDGTTDGVHPKPETIEYFSTKVCEFIEQNMGRLETYSSLLKNSDYFDLIQLEATSEKKYVFSNRSGLELSAAKIGQGEILEIDFPEPKRISGIFFIFGPDTNQLKLTLDGQQINIPMQDENSYYRRVGYRFLGLRDVNNLKVEHPNDVIDIKLAREPFERVDKLYNYLIGFSSGI